VRLTLKLIAGMACAVLVVLGVNSIVRVKRELILFDGDIRRDGRLLGKTLAGAVSRIWSTVGETGRSTSWAMPTSARATS
jgi:hypothetical protein